MNTLALSTPDMRVSRQIDLVALALALPVFIAADLPLLGYAVVAAVWLIQKALFVFGDRRVKQKLADGNRTNALGVTAVTMLGRLWLVTLAVLLVGLSDREAGLCAAILAAVLVTAHLAQQALTHYSEVRAEQAR